MAFVKLDTRILDSTTWVDIDACRMFITALLLAEPFEVREPIQSIQVRSTDPADFVVPAGWYGFVAAAGAGIARRACIDHECGLAALERLAAPDPDSRTPDNGGRRMVRVPGGYLILNYIAFRDRDHGHAERQARYRQRQKERGVTLRDGVTVTGGTHVDVDVDVDVDADAQADAKQDQDQKLSNCFAVLTPSARAEGATSRRSK